MDSRETSVQSSEIRAPSLHPDTDVGSVTLKVGDLKRSLEFYQGVVGLQTLEQEGQTASLGSGKRVILKLEEIPGARPQPANTTGLYHAAILFPDRHALAVKIAQLSAMRIRFGYADHLVSEAFYLSDPDNNGLELYRDRPRSEWIRDGRQVRMAADPIDFDNFFAEIRENDPALSNPAAPDGTKLGHMHLRVANIDEAERFYHGVLGFDVVAKMPGALFVSAGGYHHHIGMNTWESRGGKPPQEPSAGLREFSISLPDPAELEKVARQIEAAGVAVEWENGTAVVLDPFQNRVRWVTKDRVIGTA